MSKAPKLSLNRLSHAAQAMMAAGGSSEAVVWEFVPDGSKQQVICAMPKSGIISYNDSVGVVFYPGAKVGVFWIVFSCFPRAWFAVCRTRGVGAASIQCPTSYRYPGTILMPPCLESITVLKKKMTATLLPTNCRIPK
jgi:hypothetical protein